MRMFPIRLQAIVAGAFLRLLLLQSTTTFAAAVYRNTNECPSAERIQKELGPELSAGAEILTPSSPGWGDIVVVRASAPRIHPEFVVSVLVATTEDVQATVKYANHIHVPFLAVSGGHGWPTDLNRLRGGIQINLRRLNTARVNWDGGGNTATVGGGTLQHEAVQSLYAQGEKMAGKFPLLLDKQPAARRAAITDLLGFK